MRSVTLALIFTMAFVTGLQAKEPKPDVGNGHVVWFDITTTNMAKAKEFYGKLFGWTFTGVDGAGDLAAEIVSGTASIGTLRVAQGKLSAFNGVTYIQVADVAAACKKAKELGATIEPGFPFNLSGNGGAVGLAYDPFGHPFGMYSRAQVPTPAIATAATPATPATPPATTPKTTPPPTK